MNEVQRRDLAAQRKLLARRDTALTQFLIQVLGIVVGVALIVLAAAEWSQHQDVILREFAGLLGMGMVAGGAVALAIWLRAQVNGRRGEA